MILAPSQVDDIARLLGVARTLGPEFLDNFESFDRVFGAGAAANTDGEVLRVARGMVKDFLNERKK